MNIKKCDGCGKLINRKTDQYYDINGISFNNPGDRVIKLVTNHSEDSKEERKAIQSWTEYMDLDFCVECFEKLGFKKYCKEY